MRRILLWAARNGWLRERIPRLSFARRAVRRFMPGEDAESALAAAERLATRGIGVVFTRLGENLVAIGEAHDVTAHYHRLIDDAAARGLDAEVSVKLTQLGLDIPRAERIVYDDLGHVALLGSRRVARDIIKRLK